MVQDIARSSAFDKAVQSDPSCEIVVHTVSPFHYNITGTKKDLLDPTIVVYDYDLKVCEATCCNSETSSMSLPKTQPAGLLLLRLFKESDLRILYEDCIPGIK